MMGTAVSTGLGFSALRAISTMRAAEDEDVLELKRARVGVRRAAKAAFMGRRWKMRADILMVVLVSWSVVRKQGVRVRGL